MSEQPEQTPEVQAPVMTDAEVDAAQLPPQVAVPLTDPANIAALTHAHGTGYCQTCGTFNANVTA